jgi:hypothetical protein
MRPPQRHFQACNLSPQPPNLETATHSRLKLAPTGCANGPSRSSSGPLESQTCGCAWSKHNSGVKLAPLSAPPPPQLVDTASWTECTSSLVLATLVSSCSHCFSFEPCPRPCPPSSGAFPWSLPRIENNNLDSESRDNREAGKTLRYDYCASLAERSSRMKLPMPRVTTLDPSSIAVPPTSRSTVLFKWYAR